VNDRDASRPVLILGATTFSAEVADVVSSAGRQVVGFVENDDRARLGDLDGLPVHWIDDVGDLVAECDVLGGLSTTQRIRLIAQAEELGFSFATVVHPSAVVSARATVGRGVLVGAMCVIAAHASIGDFTVLNRGAMVGHHTAIGVCSTLSPGSNVAGACTLGERTYVGMGALVLDGLEVGERAVVASGAVVTSAVPDRAMVAGVPATVRKTGIDGR
jgi:sugar O-acyltransferase (sialic acid O-acetyltransferase NeuD family)